MPGRLSRLLYPGYEAPSRTNRAFDNALRDYIQNPSEESKVSALTQLRRSDSFNNLGVTQQQMLEAAVSTFLVQFNSSGRKFRDAIANFERHLLRCRDADIPEPFIGSLVKAFDNFEAYQPPPVALSVEAPRRRDEEIPKDFKKWLKSRDGTPLYKQGDYRWGDRIMGNNETIHQSGCALTSLAMALSKIKKKLITPIDLDKHLDKKNGYSDDSLNWTVAAKDYGITAQRVRSFNESDIRQIRSELSLKKPVVAGVKYVNEEGDHQRTSTFLDHWITLTRFEHKIIKRKDVWTYYANDPATGKEIKLVEKNGKFVSLDPIFDGHYFSVEKGYVIFE